MPDISHIATFSPTDPFPRMLDDLACPVCGHKDPGNAPNQISDHKVRIFCTWCGAFITVFLTEEQGQAIGRRSAEAAATGHRPWQLLAEEAPASSPSTSSIGVRDMVAGQIAAEISVDAKRIRTRKEIV